jgi:hypothetical protein
MLGISSDISPETYTGLKGWIATVSLIPLYIMHIYVKKLEIYNK